MFGIHACKCLIRTFSNSVIFIMIHLNLEHCRVLWSETRLRKTNGDIGRWTIFTSYAKLMN